MPLEEWQSLPLDVLEEEKKDKQAKLWGTNQRTIAAKAWADVARNQAQEMYDGLSKIMSEGPYPGSLPEPEDEWDKLTRGQGTYAQPETPQGATSNDPEVPGPFDKLTRSQGRQSEEPPGADPPTPEFPLPGMHGALRTPFGPQMSPIDLPFDALKPVPPSEEEHRRTQSGKMPFEDTGEAVGGIVRWLTKQGESLPGIAVGMPGFRLGADDAMRGRAFADATIDTAGAGGGGAARGVAAAGVSPTHSMGQPVSAAEAAIRKMYLDPEKLPVSPAAPGAFEKVRRTLVRKATDERVDLNELVNEAKRAIGRPLTSDEQVDEIVRLNAPMAAAQRVQEALKPALTTVRKVLGEEGPVLLRTFLTAQDNLDKAAAIGRRVESQVLKASKPPTLTDVGRQPVAMIRAGETTAAGAKAAGQEAEMLRTFSGDVNVAQSQKVRDDILARLSPEQGAALEASAQKVWDVPHDILQRKVDAGILSQEWVDDLIQKFPHYVPAQILDYLPTTTTAGGKGRKIGLSTQDISRLTEEGTAAARRDPIESVVEAAFRAERDINLNRAFTGLIDLQKQVPELGRFFREVPADYTAKSGRGEEVLEGFVNGEKVRYAVPYDLHQAVTLANKGPMAPAFMQTMLSAWRNLVTGANATFVAANAPLDAMTYIIRQASREGGPQHIPSIAKSWMEAAGDVMNGIGKQEFRGKAAEYLKEGGGVFGMTQRTPAEVTKFTAGLDRPNPFVIRNVGDIGRMAKNILTLQPVQAVAERVELIPRVASYNRANAAGERTQKAVMQGRDVTLDFQRAGTVTSVLNSYIPFFNVASQSGVNVFRTIGENPKGAAYTIGSVVATPTLLTELWNRSDPDREAAYEDVPDYIKRRSLVVMLPFTPGKDANGNPRPPFVEIRLREMMGIAAPLREATARVLGADGDGMKELALTMLANVTPLNFSSAGEVPFEVMGPGIGTVAQLGADKDMFRQRPIATEYADENAAEISKMAARALGGRPSQWEFAARNLLGTYAQMGLPASNLLAGRERRETGAVQDIPIAGGLLRRMGGVLGGIGAETGQKLQDARDGRALPADINNALAEAGIRYEPSALKAQLDDIPLLRGEQAKAQEATNTELVRRVRILIAKPVWKKMSADEKEDEIKAIAGDVRDAEMERVVKAVPPAERKERVQRQRVESQR